MDKITMWKKTFKLSNKQKREKDYIFVDYDCFDGEKILDKQKEAFEEILKNSEKVFNDEHKIIEYFAKKYNNELLNNKTNVFDLIMPRSLYIKRNDKKHVVGLMCDSKYEVEHGIVIVCENEKIVKIGIQDIIL